MLIYYGFNVQSFLHIAKMFLYNFKQSPNYDQRNADSLKAGKPWIIVIHYTGTEDGKTAEDYYLDKIKDNNAGRISPHYMIDKDGSITQYVDESNRAWHAGKSFWKNETDVNSASIGIELVNNGIEPFDDHQIESLITLCKKIKRKYGIDDHDIIGHSDIAPGRKSDPGPLFPWGKLISSLNNYRNE